MAAHVDGYHPELIDAMEGAWDRENEHLHHSVTEHNNRLEPVEAVEHVRVRVCVRERERQKERKERARGEGGREGVREGRRRREGG